MEVNVRSNKKKPPTLITGDSYIKIYGFMRSAMQLEKTELLVYALIYSYFRNSAPFTGSREYIAEWVGSGKSSVDIALAALIERGYITKTHRRERGYNFISSKFKSTTTILAAPKSSSTATTVLETPPFPITTAFLPCTAMPLLCTV